MAQQDCLLAHTACSCLKPTSSIISVELNTTQATLRTLLSRTAQAPTAALYPSQITSSLLPAEGGVRLVHVPTQVQARQANVVSRLLEPEQLAWKVFQTHHLGLAPQLQRLAYGASVIFSTVSTLSLQLPARLSGYVTAFKALQPHRLLPVSALHAMTN